MMEHRSLDANPSKILRHSSSTEIGRKKDLCQLLLTPLWAQQQIQVNGFSSLEDDFRAGMKEAAEDEEMKEALRLIANAFSLSSVHLSKNMSELWFQIHGRLLGCAQGNLFVEKYVKWIETNAGKPRVLSLRKVLLGAEGLNRKIIPVGSIVFCMALFQYGERVACGCRDGSVAVVNFCRNKIERKWQVNEEAWVWSIAVTQKSTRIVTMSKGKVNTVDIWEAGNGHHVSKIGDDVDRLSCFAITHDEDLVVSVSEGGSLQSWDLKTGKIVVQAVNVGSHVSGISLLKDGERAIICTRDGKLKVCNIKTGLYIAEFGHRTDSLGCFTVTPDELYVLSGLKSGGITLCDLANRQTRWSSYNEDHSQKDRVTCVAVSKDGSQLASGHVEGVVRIWDRESGDHFCKTLQDHTSWITAVAFLENRESILLSSCDGSVRTWDMVRGQNEQPFATHGSLVTGVSFTPDGKHVVTGSTDNTLQTWDAITGQKVGEPLQGHVDDVHDVMVTPDGESVVSVSWDTTVRVWNLKSRKLMQILRGQTDSITCVAVTPKGDRAVTGARDNTVWMWDLKNADGSHVVFERHNHAVCRVFVSDDGLRVISVDTEDNIFVWNMEMRDVLKSVVVHDARFMSRKDVFSLVGEHTDLDEGGFSIPLGSSHITHGKGSEARVVATLESKVRSWDISPGNKTICVGLENGQVGFLRVCA